MEKAIKVLAVDDESYVLKVLKACMPLPDFELTTCSDAMSAMSIFKKGTFDILLFDVVMPGIDGFELHTLVRNVNASIPIVMLTSKVDDVNGTMLKRISSDKNTYYQSKSFTEKELTAKIKEIVLRIQNENERKHYFEEMEKDIELAGDVQLFMFPNWNSVRDNLHSCFYYRPYMKITGDVYTLMRVQSNIFLSVMGDISGHGIQAALCMSAVEGSLAKLIRNFPEEELKPHNILNHLSNFISSIVAGRYMTCIISIIDLNKNTVTFQNAGHPDFIKYCSKSGDFIDVNPEKKGNIPVGLLPEVEYREEDTVTIPFSPDDILFSYTDGLGDMQNTLGKTYNRNPFKDFVETFAKDGLRPASIFRIIDAMYKLGFDEITDDISLIGLSHFIPQANVFEFLIKPMLSEVDKFAQKIANLAAQNTGNETLSAKIEILLSEFLNNVVVHGLGNKNSSRPVISARIEFGEKNITLSFCDMGKKWNMDSNDTDECDSDVLNYALAASGRGISIIKKIASSIRRSRYADMLNETIFTVEYND